MLRSFARRLGERHRRRRAELDANYLRVRRDILLHSTQLLSETGLEIGPLAAPLVSPSQGKIRYVDHCATEELREKYAGEVPPHLIAPVDIVWKPGGPSLGVCLGNQHVGYVIASHVIEHVPDLADWLKQIHDCLVENGALLLAIPDKRYTFDCARPLSTLGEVIEARRARRLRPSDKQLFDNFTMARRVDRHKLWQHYVDPRSLPYLHERGVVWDIIEQSSKGDYIDCHCWVFTPRSFLDLLLGLNEAGLICFRVEHFRSTARNQHEFLVRLRKSGDKGTAAASIRQVLSNADGQSVDVGLDRVDTPVSG